MKAVFHIAEARRATPARSPASAISIDRFNGTVRDPASDLVAVEEPLQIRIRYQQDGTWTEKDLAITMRTPGHDEELAAGFLFSEGILQTPDQILRIRQSCNARNNAGRCNGVVTELKPGPTFHAELLERHFYVSSSCGVCGKTSIESIRSRILWPLPRGTFSIHPGTIYRLPDALRTAQSVFEQTGGLHAAALFDASGNLSAVREDVGRHNALDKLIGGEFLRGALPLHRSVLLLSGRASFELIQKAVMAGIPVVAAVGAPSSLAVQMSRQFRLTLIGFLRANRFNIYSDAGRLCDDPDGEHS